MAQETCLQRIRGLISLSQRLAFVQLYFLDGPLQLPRSATATASFDEAVPGSHSIEPIQSNHETVGRPLTRQRRSITVSDLTQLEQFKQQPTQLQPQTQQQSIMGKVAAFFSWK